MPKPQKPKVVAKMLEQEGFVCVRQKGSHAIFQHDDGRRTVLPMHNRELPTGTLRAIEKQTGVTFQQ